MHAKEKVAGTLIGPLIVMKLMNPYSCVAATN